MDFPVKKVDSEHAANSRSATAHASLTLPRQARYTQQPWYSSRRTARRRRGGHDGGHGGCSVTASVLQGLTAPGHNRISVIKAHTHGQQQTNYPTKSHRTNSNLNFFSVWRCGEWSSAQTGGVMPGVTQNFSSENYPPSPTPLNPFTLPDFAHLHYGFSVVCGEKKHQGLTCVVCDHYEHTRSMMTR
jgi:hypothetical protein